MVGGFEVSDIGSTLVGNLSFGYIEQFWILDLAAADFEMWILFIYLFLFLFLLL